MYKILNHNFVFVSYYRLSDFLSVPANSTLHVLHKNGMIMSSLLTIGQYFIAANGTKSHCAKQSILIM